MAKYVIVYVGGNQPTTPEEGQKHFAKYQEWLVALGDAAISPANPLMNTQTIRPDGSVAQGSTTTISGYTIIEAESMDKALQAAKSCPFLDVDGTLEVSELGSMPG